MSISDQRAKQVVSNSPGLVNFAIGLVNFELNLPGQASEVFWGIQIKEELWNQFSHQNVFGARWNDINFGLVYMLASACLSGKL